MLPLFPGMRCMCWLQGVLLYGPPGTGKTLLARACAAQTNATFLKLAGPQLVQMFIGDGAKLVRDAFALAKEKAPTIIFIGVRHPETVFEGACCSFCAAGGQVMI